jgi:hypothetical protein
MLTTQSMSPRSAKPAVILRRRCSAHRRISALDCFTRRQRQLSIRLSKQSNSTVMSSVCYRQCGRDTVAKRRSRHGAAIPVSTLKNFAVLVIDAQTTLLPVCRSKELLARAATPPTRTLACPRVGTSARTLSPVWKPWTSVVCMQEPQGMPCLFTLDRQQAPRPAVLMLSVGTCHPAQHRPIRRRLHRAHASLVSPAGNG